LKSALYCKSEYPKTTAAQLYLYRVCLTIALPWVVQQWIMGHHASARDPRDPSKKLPI